MAAEADEFGDASFLMDFDVDAVVEQQQQRLKEQQQQQQQQPKNASGTIDTTTSNNNKRRKVLADNNNEIASGSSSSGSNNSNNNKKHKIDNSSCETSSLECTLQKYFGYDTYRDGQKDAIESILYDNKDVAIFWSTGSGKSICYQIPPLHTNRPALVVSPLISLMQDQVTKLNNNIAAGTDTVSIFNGDNNNNKKKIATYLGSGQVDNAMEESRALNCEYLLIYVTPEKLLSHGFLDKLSSKTLDLCVIAIDESHCVSEWGHDFRKEYRQAGMAIRSHPKLQSIPIVALTATAVPRTQQDIISNLCLRNPNILQRSFDRTNLKISVVRRDGMQSAMEPLIRHYLQSKNSKESTIVYVPTRNEVESVTNFLQQRLKSENSNVVRVVAYHAGLSTECRHEAHKNFLTGKVQIICATCAFGMGIDKPDCRRVIHYGPPKTVEEYYQQIGRAGRDGLPSECIMYMTDSDFTKYNSDFYIGNLNGQAKEFFLESLSALKEFALEKSKCRRKALLDFFKEKPSFGERCGTCDNCVAAKTYGDDATRDLGPIARVVLRAVHALREPSMTTLLNVIGGKVVEEYHYDRNSNPESVRKDIQAAQEDLPKRVTKDVYREIATLLVQGKYMTEATKSKNVGGFDRSWTVYTATNRGISALNDPEQPIMLIVPEAIREAERVAEAKRQRVLEQLEANGINCDVLPEEEIAKGDGEVIRSFTKWHNYIDSARKNGKEDRVEALQELFSKIQNWRSETAIELQLAPASILPEHLVASFAYTTATLKPGIKVEKSDLFAAGARTRGLETLVDVLARWVDDYQPSSMRNDSENCDDDGDSNNPMVIPDTTSMNITKWRYAVYKPAKKTGLATWEASYNRFCDGESPQSIAMSPGGNRSPIQAATVVGHLQDALVLGRPVDLGRLTTISPLPNKGQWEKLEQAELATGMDVCGDPTTSGPGGSKFTLTEILRPIMGDAFVDNPKEERTDLDKEKFSTWINLLKWYMCLKRAGVNPTFSS